MTTKTLPYLKSDGESTFFYNLRTMFVLLDSISIKSSYYERGSALMMISAENMIVRNITVKNGYFNILDNPNFGPFRSAIITNTQQHQVLKFYLYSDIDYLYKTPYTSQVSITNSTFTDLPATQAPVLDFF
jgi:hypothetical protein